MLCLAASTQQQSGLAATEMIGLEKQTVGYLAFYRKCLSFQFNKDSDDNSM